MKQIAKIACLLLGLAISNPFMKAENKKSMNIIFIGNSITAGALIADPAHDAPPVKAALYLTKQPSSHFGQILQPGSKRLHDYGLSSGYGNPVPESESRRRQVCR